MTPYANSSGDSGVREYKLGDDRIQVKFGEGKVYTYTYSSAGNVAVEAMKRLATSGRGLSTYIAQNKPRYI